MCNMPMILNLEIEVLALPCQALETRKPTVVVFACVLSLTVNVRRLDAGHARYLLRESADFW